jgi:hypothetical protein
MANLTQQEFFDIADLYPEGINIWCTESTPVTVLGVTVPFTDNEGNDVEDTLRQVQTITLPVDNDPGATVELQITSRVIRGTAPLGYYFFLVESKNITSYISYTVPILNEVIQDGEVILLPNLRGGSFYVSDYNVILNTAQDNRLSEYILKDTSITFAAIQDSLYSDTGWINARYDGSSTNKLTYSSIDSAILGSSLQGTYYPLQTPDTEINNVDVAERTYLEYFHNSLDTYPTFALETPFLFTTTTTYLDTSVTEITVIATLTNRPLVTYQPGDLLIKRDTSPVAYGQEVMKVVSMVRLTTGNDYKLTVVRGWNNTPKETLDASDELYKIQSIRMFELEGNRPSPVKQGKIRLKDTGYIVRTDLLGYLVSGSTPPII